MSRAPAPPGLQPPHFAFTPENRAAAERAIARYPTGRQASAVLALLDLAQRQHQGWLPRAAMDHVAALLKMAPIRVYEVASFYEMFNLAPVGRHHVRVCTTTPCQLRGAGAVLEACERTLGVGLGETTADGLFTLGEFECLGACVNAPIVWIGDDYFEDVDPARARELLDAFRRGEQPAPGSQVGRQTSAPASGPRTLLEGAE
ncbi:MAG: NADH-quinone oxidoreductase subunit NuoE [Alphaproteobacteria bacterium]|nr:NADH-quinone oxidoreductase subunit NuoE [Alphaproteobacteria bacterium]